MSEIIMIVVVKLSFSNPITPSTCINWHSTERKSFPFPLPFILIHLCYHVLMASFILWVISHYFFILMLKLFQIFVLLLSFFFFLAVQSGLSDLSSLNRDQTVPPAVEAWSPNHWAARELPVPVLTSESLFKLSSVSF